MVDAPHRPAPSPAAQDLAEESRVGSSEAARAVNVCLLALSRTARAFTLYDARNQAVGEFLADLHAKLGRALELAGGQAASLRQRLRQDPRPKRKAKRRGKPPAGWR